MDGYRGRARKAPQEALSADDAGRVTSEAAPSKHPKGRGSRPITPQDEVSENDSPTLWVFGTRYVSGIVIRTRQAKGKPLSCDAGSWFIRISSG